MPNIPKIEQNKLDELSEMICSGGVSNDFLVQLIELSGAFLNLKTIPDYCKATGISYNGAKKCRNVKEIFGVKFIIDNE